MLSISNLSYFIGGRALYEDISLHIKPRDRIGLIGANGTGKSTLLRLITGEYTPDNGSISRSNDCTIGFLNQDLLSYDSGESILHVTMKAFERQLELEKQIEKTLQNLEKAYTDDLVEKLSALQEEFAILDGYSMQAKAEEILEGLGFATADLKKPLRSFSGGWRMRVMLAKLLLAKPSLLMLDEPTNHLDLPSIQWIENYLTRYEGAVIVVSHDRTFLDNTVTTIAELSAQGLNVYAGNYSFYEEEKELRAEIHQNAYENQQSKIKQTERFIERFKAKASKARQVQSKVKALEKLDVIEEMRDETAKVNFRFSFSTQPGKIILSLDDISKNYGDVHVLEHARAQLVRGDKVALIGANGKGKSTLLRIIADTEKFDGAREEGYNVVSSFFAQHQLESLHVDNTLLEELKQCGSAKTEMELRSILGCFLFSDDDVFKKIKVLSGGEKSRVALAKVLISEANFLLLDEPTNHLDMFSVNILAQALQQYQGTFVVVSHDRHFITQVANKIWYIEDREIKEYPGSFDEYIVWQDERKKETAPAEEKPKVQVQQTKEKPKAKSNGEVSKSKILAGIEKAEQLVLSLEEKKAKLEAEMAKPDVFGNPDKLASVNMEYQKVLDELESQQKIWEELVTEMENIE